MLLANTYIGSAADQWTGNGMEIEFTLEYDDSTMEFILDCDTTWNTEDWCEENDLEDELNELRSYINQYKGKRFDNLEDIDAIISDELGRNHGTGFVSYDDNTDDMYAMIW